MQYFFALMLMCDFVYVRTAIASRTCSSDFSHKGISDSTACKAAVDTLDFGQPKIFSTDWGSLWHEPRQRTYLLHSGMWRNVPSDNRFRYSLFRYAHFFLYELVEK